MRFPKTIVSLFLALNMAACIVTDDDDGGDSGGDTGNSSSDNNSSSNNSSGNNNSGNDDDGNNDDSGGENDDGNGNDDGNANDDGSANDDGANEEPVWDCVCSADCDGIVDTFEELICSDAETLDLALDLAVTECALDLEDAGCFDPICECDCEELLDYVCE